MTGGSYSALYEGALVPFADIGPADDWLHAVEDGAPFTRVETYLLGFNVPDHAINCNIYLLWHPVFGCMSAHIFVTKGAVCYRHQLEAPYFNEHQYLPAATGPNHFVLQMGSCTADIRILEPFQKLAIRFVDEERDFAVDVVSTAALPPVGRPGGQHFTQLMYNHGTLRLLGQNYTIDSHYMRDRSWGYQRPEGAEAAPPYRWMTAWNTNGDGMVIAWLDPEMLADRFADWRTESENGRAANKWEHGGATPSVNLRSGWISHNGEIRGVQSVHIECTRDAGDERRTRGIALTVTDATGQGHHIAGTVTQSYPKMYWQTMLTWMHMVELNWDGVTGHGDLMDTFSHVHFDHPNSD